MMFLMLCTCVLVLPIYNKNICCLTISFYIVDKGTGCVPQQSVWPVGTTNTIEMLSI